MLEEYLDKNTIILIPNNRKRNLLEKLSKINKLVPVKIMTFTEFLNSYYFTYDAKTLYYLVVHKNIKIEIATIYLENMYAIEDKNYNSAKIKQLLALKKELQKEGLLYEDVNFKNFLKKRKIIVFRNTVTDLIEKALKKIEQETYVVYLDHNKTKKQKEVLKFSTIDDEVHFIASEILKKKEEGIPFSKIHLTNVTSEYQTILPRIFLLYHIPLNIPSTSSLYSTVLAQKYLSLIKEKNTLQEVMTELEKENHLPHYHDLITISNRYNWYEGELKTLLPLLKRELQKKKIKQIKIKEAVNIDPLYLDYDDDYCFFVGFNQGNVPKTYKDEDYLSDLEKEQVELYNSVIKNKKEKEKLLDFIDTTKNMTITFKDRSTFSSYYPSSMIQENNFNVVEKTTSKNVIYSKLDSKLTYAKELDQFLKYGTKSPTLELYYNHFKDFKYGTYDNNFTGINKETFYEHIDHKLTLSYSSLDDYYRCGFRYYLGKVLKLETKEESFAQRIGTIFHNILAIAFNDNFDLDQEFLIVTRDYEFSKKEKFFLKKLKEELRFIIETIKKQQNLSAFQNSLQEQKIYQNKDRNIKITFMGIIDKILYQESNGMTYVAVIDYKTGTPMTNLSNTIYGIEMQLPIYLYLVKNSNLFQNVKFTGFYLQKILNNEITINHKESYLELKEKCLRLTGYSSSEEYLVEKVDINYQNSTVIQGMKITSKGFAHYSKVISEEDMDKLIQLVDDKIEGAITDILAVKFPINPKKIGFENKGCEFCPYAEICYKTDKNIVYLKEYHDLDFLGGE